MLVVALALTFIFEGAQRFEALYRRQGDLLISLYLLPPCPPASPLPRVGMLEGLEGSCGRPKKTGGVRETVKASACWAFSQH